MTQRTRIVGIFIGVLGLCTGLAGASRAQQVGHTSLEVRMPKPASPVNALDRIHLIYELHLTNFGATPARLASLEVLGDGATIGGWSGPQLWQRIRIVGADARPLGQTLEPGLRAIAFLWVTLPQGRSAPGSLSHRLMLARSDGAMDELVTLPEPLAQVAPLMRSPVRGGPWVAARGPSPTSGHRLSVVALHGVARIPQRAAVDWVRLGDNGLPFTGDGRAVHAWAGFGQPVYAVAAGVVVLVRDGLADSQPLDFVPPAIIDPAEATGNLVVIELAPGQFASYAHLAAGSIVVQEGDRIREGQELARIGNSGNSLGPHLHFQLSDAREPLGGEGLPFAIDAFTLVGQVTALQTLLSGTPWTTNARQPARAIAGDMPLENMVVHFGPHAP